MIKLIFTIGIRQKRTLIGLLVSSNLVHLPMQLLSPGLTHPIGSRNDFTKQQTGYRRPIDNTVTYQINKMLDERVSLTINNKNTSLFPY